MLIALEIVVVQLKAHLVTVLAVIFVPGACSDGCGRCGGSCSYGCDTVVKLAAL